MLRHHLTGTALAESRRVSLGKTVMGTVAEFKASKNEGPSAAYANGFADGQWARAEGGAPTLYLQVGIDDYAKGFRAGFFGQLSPKRTVDER